MITRGSLGIWRRSISRGILFSSERLRHLPPVEWLFLRRQLVLGKLLLPLRTILVGCVVGEPQAIVFLVSTGQHFQMQDAAWDQCDVIIKPLDQLRAEFLVAKVICPLDRDSHKREMVKQIGKGGRGIES